MKSLNDMAVISCKNEEGWVHKKTISIEKLVEHQMIVMLDTEIDLMDSEWKIDLNQ